MTTPLNVITQADSLKCAFAYAKAGRLKVKAFQPLACLLLPPD